MRRKSACTGWKARLLAGLICAVLATLPFVSVQPALATTYPYDTTSGDSVKLRRSPNGSAVVLANIEEGDSITVLGVSGKYYQIKYKNITGYAMQSFVDGLDKVESVLPAGVNQAPSAISGYPYDTTTRDRAKLRKTAEEDATVLLILPKGAALTVVNVDGEGYARVKYDGKTGYVKTDFINIADIATPTPKPTPTLKPALSKYDELSLGDAGTSVRALQEALSELGFYTGDVDSTFGAKTKEAVLAFEIKNKLTEDGIADRELQLLLYEKKPLNAKGKNVSVKTLPPVDGVTIRLGDTGLAVEKLHKRLNELGYYLGEMNAVCTRETLAAVKAFQKNNKIKADGLAGADTQTALYAATALSATQTATPTPGPTLAPPKGSVRAGDKSEDVTQVQKRLAELGYYTGAVDGNFGSGSVNALKAFQAKAGLTKDGVCGTKTITVLFSADAPSAVTASTTTAPLASVTPLPTLGTVVITQDNVVVIRAGARGDAVYNVQARLTALGYYTSRLDGVYLDDDIAAVRSFQKANGLKVDGTAGYETQSLLFSENAVVGSASTGVTVTLRYGDQGENVVKLQSRLIELGYLSSLADGVFGVTTKSALIAFQRANGLARDGVAGTKTQEALYATTAVGNTLATSATLKPGTVSNAVKELQQRLIALGFLTGTADGNFGIQTTAALIAFQKRNGLTADGVAGSGTLSTLNSSSVKPATGVTPTPKPTASVITGGIDPSKVRYANWYSEIRAQCKLYPNATVYDFTTGISWQVNMFSLGAHADSEPLTAEDTAKMNQAFGGVTTWTPKAVWVIMSDGRIYMASTHNTPHGTSHIKGNNFSGHLCIHFPRTEAQVEAIGPYATSHQKAIDLGWTATLKRMGY